jgi:hypothetical protein
MGTIERGLVALLLFMLGVLTYGIYYASKLPPDRQENFANAAAVGFIAGSIAAHR